MPVLKILNKISDMLDRLCKGLAVSSIAALIIIMFIQVLKRAIMGSAITWADGTARYLLIWSTFLGATVATKESGHISLTFIQDKLKGKPKMVFECILMLGFAVLAIFTLYAGIMVLEYVIPQKSDSLPISVAWIYGAIPFCEAIIAVHLFTNTANKIADIAHGKTEEVGAE